MISFEGAAVTTKSADNMGGRYWIPIVAIIHDGSLGDYAEIRQKFERESLTKSSLAPGL